MGIAMPPGREIVTNAAVQPDPQRMAHERMADRHFVEVRERAEQHEVVEVQIVAGVHAQPERVRAVGGRGIARRRVRPRLALLNARANGSV